MKKKILKILLIILGFILGFILIAETIFLVCLFHVEEKTLTKATQYEKYLGENGKYRNVYMKNDIFPYNIKEDNVLEFNYKYLNHWDGHYCGYIVVKYDDKDYKNETSRLMNIDNAESDYVFPYRQLGLQQSKYGIIYSMSLDDYTIAYVDIRYTDDIIDIDYNKIIPSKYLPSNIDIPIIN